MRQLVAVVVGAAAAALGALIVGEYPFTGFTPYLAGVLFGLVIAEVMVAIARRPGVVIGVLAAVAAAGGVAYGAWDDSGYGLRTIPIGAWVGVALAAVIAALRGGVIT